MDRAVKKGISKTNTLCQTRSLVVKSCEWNEKLWFHYNTYQECLCILFWTSSVPALITVIGCEEPQVNGTQSPPLLSIPMAVNLATAPTQSLNLPMIPLLLNYIVMSEGKKEISNMLSGARMTILLQTLVRSRRWLLTSGRESQGTMHLSWSAGWWSIMSIASSSWDCTLWSVLAQHVDAITKKAH